MTAVLTLGSVPAYIVEVLSGPQAQEVKPLSASNNSGNSATHPYNARIGVLRELHTRKSDRSCLHVELDIQDSGLHYEAGDHVGTWNLTGCSLLCMWVCSTDDTVFCAFKVDHMSLLPNLCLTRGVVMQPQYASTHLTLPAQYWCPCMHWRADMFGCQTH